MPGGESVKLVYAMPDEPLGLSTVPPALTAPGDYEDICATVMKSARGRWFLAEYARRNRHADTMRVLDAIARIEAVIRGECGREADQGIGSELAGPIPETHVEAAGIEPPAAGRQAAHDGPSAPSAPDLFAAAERIQDLVWTMRERGIDPSTCDEIGGLASAILSAAALRDPEEPRVHKLNEALSSLERRMRAMLEDCAQGARAAPAALAAPASVLEHAPSDPLAALMAMTDEERIALFT
jgi:chemotaxis protein CheZ